ncbi:LOW QUALITY PROTEIN: hypothetical protein T265_15119 [Opisthorchis viverrini]|uniref:Uncharacterized protein n=1 Tax=Opisthorchis viverrini TaxID=6198 RepID=A0A074ZDN0_OPIVI|nr:LOW QUALITY PROTEIN: hypothetical protein T265_15119 [Opisthorchis viverrini]KER21305.1 LOW QUALITY PROTEIN: hypothetical protein T265_15119 [Opisthorchis viverrini]
MAVPCHHWPDMLQFLDSPVTDVTFEMIRLGSLSSGIHFSLVEETSSNEADMGLQSSFLVCGLWHCQMHSSKEASLTPGKTNRSSTPDSELPAMGDALVPRVHHPCQLPAMGDALVPRVHSTPVPLEGWRVYECTMVQRNRVTLPAGRTRPAHEVFFLRACYQIW